MYGPIVGLAYGPPAEACRAKAAPIVGDQSERGQTLVNTGLYGWVRHPMYAGHLLFLLGLPLWLGSLAATLLVPVVFAPLVGRILVEERSLRKGLAGYAEYIEQVRYRLIPKLW